jgi:hypothetical protein
MAKYAGVTDAPTFIEYGAYVEVDALVQGLKKAGPDPIKASLIKALGSITGYNAAGLYGGSFTWKARPSNSSPGSNPSAETHPEPRGLAGLGDGTPFLSSAFIYDSGILGAATPRGRPPARTPVGWVTDRAFCASPERHLGISRSRTGRSRSRM